MSEREREREREKPWRVLQERDRDGGGEANEEQLFRGGGV